MTPYREFLNLANVVLWLDSTFQSTVFQDTNKSISGVIDGPIKLWDDLSLNKTPLQGNGLYIETSNNEIIFKAIDFSLSGFNLNTPLNQTLTPPFTIWMVLKSNVPGGGSIFNSNGFSISIENDKWTVENGIKLEAGPVDTEWRLLQLTVLPNMVELKIDGVIQNSGNIGNIELSDVTLSSGNWSGEMGMLLIQKGIPSSDEVSQIENYAAKTFGLFMLDNLFLLLDAGDTSTLFTDALKTTLSLDGERVSLWADKSGWDHDVLDSSELKSPTLEIDIINGGKTFNTLNFADLFNYLGCTFVEDLSPPHTIWVVARLNNAASWSYLFAKSSNSGDGFFAKDNEWHLATDTSSPTDTNWHLFRFEYTPLGTTLWIDNTPHITSGVTSNPVSKIKIGSDFGEAISWGGQISFIAIQRSIPSPLQISTINNYIANKFGITVEM